MPEHVRVVIIGGGAVGCSCLYHLARMGCSDALLLEQNELTSGSTWHAAGNCPTFSTNWGLLQLQRYSAALYRELAQDPAAPINYHVTGSVRLAHTEDRMDEYRHVLGMARANGLHYELLTPTELRIRYPLVELHGLRGALWDPEDGDIDPAQLTQALAAGARRLGGRVQRFSRVTGLEQAATGEWHVRTDKTEYVAETVVNAAGYRAGEVMALLGRTLPAVTLSHQYLVTGDIPELVARSQRLPLLRDPDVSYYLRQERGGLILGPYEQRARAAWLEAMPEDFSYQLWGEDLERLEPYLDAACRRVPVLATAGIRRVVNGPIPYSPDGLPYLGPAHGLANFFQCNTFSFGITQAGGAGHVLAHWILDGGPPWDLWSVDARRFSGYATRHYTLARALETYEKEYAPAFPYEERSAGRPVRTAPLHRQLSAEGAVFGVRGGWEQALWFDPGAKAPEQTLSFRRARNWFASVGEEVRAVRQRIGLLDLPGFSKFMIQGPGAESYLDRLLCTRLPSAGHVALGYALDARGHLLSEFTLTRLGEHAFYVVSAAAAELHDDDLLTHALPPDGSVRIEPLTQQWGTIVLAGPCAREVLGRMTHAQLSNEHFPWLTGRWVSIASTNVLALRINYVGELGWELHARNESLPAIHALAREIGAPFGMRPFGLYALDSLRIDKGYRGWKTDLDRNYSPLEASLARFVDLDKAQFVGRAALLEQARRGPAYRSVSLVLDEPGSADAPYCSSVFAHAELVGIVTSGVWSHTLSRSIALAYVRSAFARPGTILHIDILGERCAAKVAREPLFDPQNLRLRA